MSTLLDEESATRIRSEEDLTGYFHAFVKSEKCMRVGIEAEFFAVHKKTGKSLPYEGYGGVEDILKTLSERFCYEKIMEGGYVIALRKGDTMITLEPGGQIELSASPVRNVFDIQKQLQTFFSEIREVSRVFPHSAFLASGIQPFCGLEEVPWVPKERYKIMVDYFSKRGRLSYHMMKLTATNQVNYDYLSEEDAMAGLRVVFGITSIVTALFANSCFSDGAPNGYMSRRLEIWNHTDPDRTGIIMDFLREGRNFADYLNYVLGVPMIFIVRDGQWMPVHGLSFRKFLREGFGGTQATFADFQLHLSSIFPEVRLKKYLEIRGVDGQRPELIPSVAAFWKGILYNVKARQKAWSLVAHATDRERQKLHGEVPKLGLRAKLGQKPIFEIAEELVYLSCSSLDQQGQEGGRSECQFLREIVKEIIIPGKSPAEALLEKWNGELRQKPRNLIRYLSLS